MTESRTAAPSATSMPAPAGSLREAIAAARNSGIADDSDVTAQPVPIRHVARRSGVSAAQISRIESGHVRRPGPEILMSLARGLNRNPLPLMVLAGHISLDEGRKRLLTLFREGAELPESWGDARIPVERVREILADPSADEHDVFVIASDVFAVAETQETMWDESHKALLARGEASADLRELLDYWNYMGHDRRRRLLAYARELRGLTDLKYQLDRLRGEP
ncbi:MAG: helix-turn-helix domain-containing protein [Solirubrobacteraceae bacterium]